ncbi:DUF1638 domain-containing protein [Luminiphilus sp.]|nr:DUF1638 domain-containing protein [Luminiphilus sp.]
MMGATLIIACGALAREIDALKRANGWDQLQVQCLDAALHNSPKSIPAKVDALLEQHFHHYERVFVAYADCGTGGALDTVLARWGVSRLPGAHCYEVFATSPVFHALAAAEPGTFYLTDFLARHFDRLVIKDLKLDTHPALQDMLFGHYQRVVYLAQTDDPTLLAKAQKAADRLGLAFEVLETGLASLQSALMPQVLHFDHDREAHHATH